MSFMFADAHKFNQAVGDWNVSKVFNMCWMFEDAWAFNQDLTRWNMRSVEEEEDALHMFRQAHAMQRGNKPTAVYGWATCFMTRMRE